LKVNTQPVAAPLVFTRTHRSLIPFSMTVESHSSGLWTALATLLTGPGRSYFSCQTPLAQNVGDPFVEGVISKNNGAGSQSEIRQGGDGNSVWFASYIHSSEYGYSLSHFQHTDRNAFVPPRGVHLGLLFDFPVGTIRAGGVVDYWKFGRGGAALGLC